MQPDEKDIVDYLKGWPNSFVSGKEIARKVGGKERFDEDRGWAIPILTQMVRIGILETDHLGYFRLKPEVRKKRQQLPQHVSPQILKILKSSGKSFDGVEIADEPLNPRFPSIANPARHPRRPRGTKPEPAPSLPAPALTPAAA